MRRLLVAVTVLGLIAGCGDADSAASTTEPVATTALDPSTTSSTTSPTTTAPPETTTTPPETTTTTQAATTTTAVPVVLGGLPAGDAVAGEALFDTSMVQVRLNDACSTCHSPNGAGRGWGNELDGLGEQADQRVPGLTAVEYLHQSIIDPETYMLDGWDPNMPTNYGAFLTDQEIADLIAYLLGL